ncbi:integration host factor subunit alpha [Desmospora sp. 8437]|nr:integration host factor subunit alpha [Desmospora sp. 8437]
MVKGMWERGIPLPFSCELKPRRHGRSEFGSDPGLGNFPPASAITVNNFFSEEVLQNEVSGDIM